MKVVLKKSKLVIHTTLFLSLLSAAMGTFVVNGAEDNGWKTQGKGGPKKAAQKSYNQAIKEQQKVEAENPANKYVVGGIPASKENKQAIAQNEKDRKAASAKVEQKKVALDKHAGSNKEDMRGKIRNSLKTNKILLDKIQEGGHIYGTPNRDASKSYFVTITGKAVAANKLGGYLEDLLNNSEMEEDPEIGKTKQSGDKKLVILTPRDGRVTGKQEHTEHHKVKILWDAVNGVWDAYPSQ